LGKTQGNEIVRKGIKINESEGDSKEAGGNQVGVAADFVNLRRKQRGEFRDRFGLQAQDFLRLREKGGGRFRSGVF